VVCERKREREREREREKGFYPTPWFRNLRSSKEEICRIVSEALLPL
jgi:hypothetical protein